MTGPELKQLRADLSEAIGKGLTAADMAKLCGLSEGGADTIRRWEVSGPSGRQESCFAFWPWPAIAIRSWKISMCSTVMTSANRTGRHAAQNFAKGCATKCAAVLVKTK